MGGKECQACSRRPPSSITICHPGSPPFSLFCALASFSLSLHSALCDWLTLSLLLCDTLLLSLPPLSVGWLLLHYRTQDCPHSLSQRTDTPHHLLCIYDITSTLHCSVVTSSATMSHSTSRPSSSTRRSRKTATLAYRALGLAVAALALTAQPAHAGLTCDTSLGTYCKSLLSVQERAIADATSAHRPLLHQHPRQRIRQAPRHPLPLRVGCARASEQCQIAVRV